MSVVHGYPEGQYMGYLSKVQVRSPRTVVAVFCTILAWSGS